MLTPRHSEGDAVTGGVRAARIHALIRIKTSNRVLIKGGTGAMVQIAVGVRIRPVLLVAVVLLVIRAHQGGVQLGAEGETIERAEPGEGPQWRLLHLLCVCVCVCVLVPP